MRHYQTIWHLAQGRTVSETAGLTGFTPRWIEQLLSRYNSLGASALGDRRRRNGSAATVLTPEVLAKLKARLDSEPEGGGLWTSKKAAAFLASELGLKELAAQRGREALRAVGHSRQTPRPRHAAAATPEEQAAFKKNSPTPSNRKGPRTRTPSSRSSRPTSTGSA